MLAGILLAAVLAPRHDLHVRLDPDAHRLEVRDAIVLPAGEHRFTLHEGLEPTTATKGVRLRREDDAWIVKVPAGTPSIELAYAGSIHHPVENKGEDYARSFGETRGTIGPDGVVLSGTTAWIPTFDDAPFPFTLEVRLPAGWDAVSQGARTRHERDDSGTVVVWDSPEPQTEVYLIAAKFVETSRREGKVEAMAFLRERDDPLAAKYLDATARYLKMYEDLLGPYPYAKFALVENFWETGYGMPSFTLLGPKVIRLPFILNSSYPHEILHNWWGNGVFVDPARGNWCEGLTAYLADHLLQEQSGDASEYRQSTLQKYADYVSKAKDFPLAEFRERHSPATEAVGYGKSLLFFHELRRALGDETFAKGLRRFYETNRFRAATFDDLARSMGEVSGRDLAPSFRQAIDRTGAPRLALREVRVTTAGAVEGVVQQLQPEDPFALDLPLLVTTDGRPVEATVALRGRTTPFSIPVPGKALRLDADPAFDVFRKLDPLEIPPALSGVFGAERTLAILPSTAAPGLREAYRALATEWTRAEPGRVEVRDDADVTALPKDRSVWIFGKENRFAKDGPAVPGATGAGLATVAVARHPDRPDLAIGYVAADRAAQVPGLGRKLPHYHKYSYLAFEGDEPTNVAKGRWPVAGSPMTVSLVEGAIPERAALPKRAPLASPPPAFSTDRIAAVVRALSSSEMDGRKPGTDGHAKASAFVERGLREAGLRVTVAADGPRNVVATLPGTKPDYARQSVVVGAHYDHLGTGHPGADDNASGVAALLELARAFASGPPPDRTILFVAFDSEEEGRLGSRRFVEDLKRDGIEVRGMINLDTVGRLGAGKILVLGTGTASEWVHVFRGAGFVTGYPVEGVASDPGGSDQVSFQEAGIPAVQLFTGPHLDYHASGDTSDKVDAAGVAKVAAVAREAVEWLAGRAEPLTKTGSTPAGGDGSGRRVSLGTVPDFAFAGPGMKLDGVVPGSPAEKAGLAKGDVIVKLGDVDTPDLRAFSAALKALAPGSRVKVTYVRDGKQATVEAEIVARGNP